MKIINLPAETGTAVIRASETKILYVIILPNWNTRWKTVKRKYNLLEIKKNNAKYFDTYIKLELNRSENGVILTEQRNTSDKQIDPRHAMGGQHLRAGEVQRQAERPQERGVHDAQDWEEQSALTRVHVTHHFSEQHLH